MGFSFKKALKDIGYYAASPYVYGVKKGYDQFIGDPAAEAEARANEQIAAEHAEQERIRTLRGQNLARVDEIYGIGSSNEANKNQATIAQMLREYYQAVLQANLGEADQSFSRVSRVGRQNLARMGQLGGSLDAEAQSGNLADYLRARSGAVSAARGAKDSVKSRLTSQRLATQQQVTQNPSANPDFSAVARDSTRAISDAQAQIPQATVANLFRSAGDTYYQGSVQEAQGNQGLQAFTTPRTSGAGGRTTGG